MTVLMFSASVTSTQQGDEPQVERVNGCGAFIFSDIISEGVLNYHTISVAFGTYVSLVRVFVCLSCRISMWTLYKDVGT